MTDSDEHDRPEGMAQQNAAVNWPSKPIHAVVPLAPGTGGDVMARLMLNQLAQQLGPARVDPLLPV